MKFKLKTVDVWDTLLRRKCHPDTIKYATAKYFYFKFFKFHGIKNIKTLFDKRVEIERDIGRETTASGYDDEYLFESVIYTWCEFFIKGYTEEDLKVAADELCKYEFGLEMALTSADAKIVELLNNNPSQQTLFLSDFYMSKDRLRKLIAKNGLDAYVPDGISSADIKLNKRSGRLFDYVKDKLDIKPSEWLHIGDNEWSDVSQPGKRGINCIHYVPKEAHNERMELELLFHDKGKLFQNEINSVLNSIPEEYKSHVKDNENFRHGVNVSPFIVGYSLFILEKAIEFDCKKIYFFTREGEFFIKAFNLLLSSLKSNLPDIKFPEFNILEVSRLATFAASINEVSTLEMMRIWNLYSSQSMDAFFKTLDIDKGKLNSLLYKYQIPAEEVIRYPWQDSRVQALFSDVNFIKILTAHRDEKRELLTSYLKIKGLDNASENVCVVDVGWRGTIQDNIALCLPEVNFHGIYLGLAKFLNPQPDNSRKYAYGPDLNISQDLPHYLDSVAPIEMITNSPSGSVVGYERIGESIKAVRKIDEGENKAWISFTQDFQNGILFALKKWVSGTSLYLITSDDLKPVSLKIWGDLITGVNESLNNAFSNLNHNETFGLGGYVSKNHTPTLKDIFRSVFDWNKRRELIDFIIANQWSDGIRRRRDLTFIHRHVLASIIDLAVFYKRKVKRR
ncbi:MULTISPECIES: HAD family hydrolase [unclassified Pantoea]|uniref:HAD family hydrolase n=1 Tax=unclassified Pantoea TaxID=2630326 RepID=UPI0001E0C271|nr:MULTISPECIES: HAD family hydrolase [unclassified Pantoea]EFM19402.1 hydrolase (HAD superfamily)-like protein [Pantoea sp. aB]QNQ59992.1 HAD family hydrolase [Pantoea sp. MT58]